MAVWLITGCSTGLGRALALAVLEQGHQLVATTRDVTTIQDIADAHPDSVLALALDVTDDAAVAASVEQAQRRFGGVDVLVNNAGYGYRAAVEEGEDAKVRALFETNFFGAVAMVKAVLPGMRERRSGAIVNISSIGARISPAGSGYYAAAKSALEGLSASLRKEVAPLGITVVVVEPGGFRTDFAGRSLQQADKPIADYADSAGRRRKENDTADGNQPGDPVKAADAIISTVQAADPPLLLLLGNDALAGFTAVAEAQQADVAAWQSVTTSTDL